MTTYPASCSRPTKTLASGSYDGTILLWDLLRLLAVPHILKEISGIEQKGPAGTELPQALEVSVRDQNGEPYPGAIVTFVVTAGGGTLSATTDTTDANGNTATILTLWEPTGHEHRSRNGSGSRASGFYSHRTGQPRL